MPVPTATPVTVTLTPEPIPSVVPLDITFLTEQTPILDSTPNPSPTPIPTPVFTPAPMPVPSVTTSGSSVIEALSTITPLPTPSPILNETTDSFSLATTISHVLPSILPASSVVPQIKINKIAKKDLPNQSSKSLASIDAAQNTKSNKTFIDSILAVAAIVLLYLLLL